METSALAVELVSVDRVFLSPSNPRLNDAAVPHVAASLRRTPVAITLPRNP